MVTKAYWPGKFADRLPVFGLGADIMVGFPGETDEDHAATARLVQELPYTYLHVFPYSVREGTPAAKAGMSGWTGRETVSCTLGRTP